MSHRHLFNPGCPCCGTSGSSGSSGASGLAYARLHDVICEDGVWRVYWIDVDVDGNDVGTPYYAHDAGCCPESGSSGSSSDSSGSSGSGLSGSPGDGYYVDVICCPNPIWSILNLTHNYLFPPCGGTLTIEYDDDRGGWYGNQPCDDVTLHWFLTCLGSGNLWRLSYWRNIESPTVCTTELATSCDPFVIDFSCFSVHIEESI